MPSQQPPGAVLTTVAVFPESYLLENLAVRSDGSILVTAALQKELWYVPPATAGAQVEPLRLETFDQVASGIVETEPDVFYVSTTNLVTMQESFLHRVDLRGWSPGDPVRTVCVLEFDKRAGGLNGSCLLGPSSILLADSVSGLIWRVDISPDGRELTARVWLKHESMDVDPASTIVPPQPGVNGVRYAARSNYLYYTSTAQKLFMRVPVDAGTLDPAGPQQLVAGGTMPDDFCIDEEAGVAYVTTHRQNTIDRVPLDPAADQRRQIVVGEPLDEQLVGPTSVAWGRAPGDYGRIAYVTTDGGFMAPPSNEVRLSKLVRLELSGGHAGAREAG
ncbi:MAG TPA: hypothetical protein VEH29_00710 [Acidimicrobiales bacterium]|nr:hypothetical protein [Acidimicrobiales bacterium]